jgi:hypothetical protein
VRTSILAAAAAALLLPVTSQAEVIRFDILERAPAFSGRSFGAVGSFERITAKATIALDPKDDRNAVITDLAQAPRGADGRVEAATDVVILRPADPTRSNGTLFVEVPNRGRKLAPQLFDESAQPGATRAERPEDAGIGFLQNQGYTIVWVGWQGDIPSRLPGSMALNAPVLKGVTGPARRVRVRQHDQPCPRHAHLASRGSRQSQRYRARRLGRCTADAIGAFGKADRSRDGGDHAARWLRRRRALRGHLHRT